jgi:hypothetical protein
VRGEKFGANLPLFWNNDGKDKPKGQICPLAKKEVFLFDGPSPPFEGSSRKISQNGAPAKSYSAKNTVHTIPNIPTGKCRYYLTDTGQTASKQMGYNSTLSCYCILAPKIPS